MSSFIKFKRTPFRTELTQIWYMHQEFVVFNPLNPPYQGDFKRR